MAAQRIWWQPADVSLRNRDRVIARVLELGTFEAGQRLRVVLGDRHLARVPQRAEAGWFSPRSWNDWQLKLDLARSGAVPPLPHATPGMVIGAITLPMEPPWPTP
jgi:hypothetical protein